MSTLDAVAAEHLAEHGWIRRPSGRFVHPDLELDNGRRRVFTLGQAMTLTQASIAAATECPECGGDHAPHVETAQA